MRRNSPIRNLQRNIGQREGLRRILSNIGWLMMDRLLRMFIGLLVGVWVARYLGPKEYGTLNFALAFVALLTPIAALGLKNVVVRDLVRAQHAAQEILGTTLGLQLIGGLLAAIAAIELISLLRPEADDLRKMVAILSGTLVVQAGRTASFWFESRVASRYIVWAENSAVLTVAVVRVALIGLEAPLCAFIWAVLVEATLAAIAMIGVYTWKTGSLQGWRFRWEIATHLLGESWPLILSGVGLMLYMKIDQIMLGQMTGETSVGIYSAALRLSEVWYVVPTVIASSLFPAILKSKAANEELYQARMQRFLDFMVLTAVVIAAGITFFADSLIKLLFGTEFADAGPILKIHVWACVFVYIGLAGTRWYLAEGLQKHNLYRNLSGAAVNIAMNLVLIPLHGPYGAAIATLVSYSLANYLMDLIYPPTRPLFRAKSRALFANSLLFRFAGDLRGRNR